MSIREELNEASAQLEESVQKREALEAECSEIRVELARITGIINRNRASFEVVKAQAIRWRDRAIAAEAIVADRKSQDPFSFMEN